MTHSFRVLLIAAMVALPLALQAQTTRNVLIEVGTGTWCQYCPEGADTLTAILARTPNAKALCYHDGDPMATPEGDAVQDSLHITGYPKAAIDRIVWQIQANPPAYDIALSRGVWGIATSIRAQQTSPMMVSIAGSFDTTSRMLSGTVNMTALEIMTGAFSVHVVVSEDSLNYAQNRMGQIVNPYYHKHVVRKVLTGVNGVSLTSTGFSVNQQLFHNFNYQVPPTFEIRRMKVTAFVDKVYPVAFGHRDIQQSVQEKIWNNPGVFTFLPVNLTSFNAERADDGVRLSWRTADELNNKGWNIERATESEPWRTIAFVNGSGTISTSRDYGYTDASIVEGNTYLYRLRQIDFDGKEELSSVVMVICPAAPATARLHQNYPNPFNPSTEIAVDMTDQGNIRLEVYDLMGRMISLLANGSYPAGTHRFNWRGIGANGAPLPAGVYTCRLITDSGSEMRRMVLAR